MKQFTKGQTAGNTFQNNSICRQFLSRNEKISEIIQLHKGN